MKAPNKEAVRITRNFVTNVRFICQTKGLKIGDVEERGGVSKGYLSRLYGSNEMCELYNAYLIARAIDIPLDDLLTQNYARDERIREVEEELAMLKGEINAEVTLETRDTK